MNGSCCCFESKTHDICSETGSERSKFKLTEDWQHCHQQIPFAIAIGKYFGHTPQCNDAPIVTV